MAPQMAPQMAPRVTQVPPGGEALRDIHGLDGAPWWPPAPGWWVLAALVLVFGLALLSWRPRPRWTHAIPVLRLGHWRGSATQALRSLRRRAAAQPAKQTAGELSELLRRIAMARLGRSACAGLTGDGWLHWLAANDPNGFDWPQHGRLLVTTPYAPASTDDQTAALRRLIDATAAWISAPPGPEEASAKGETAHV